MVLAVFDEEFRALVIPTRNTDIVLSVGFVEVCEAPVNHSQIALFVINYDVERFNVTVHDAVRVRIVECLQYLVNIELDIQRVKDAHKLLGLDVRDKFEHQTRRLRALFAHHIVHPHNVRPTVQVLQDFRLTVDLLCSDRLQDLDHALLVVYLVASLIDLGIFAASEFLHDFVIGKIAPLNVVLSVVRIILWTLRAHILIWARKAASFDDWRNSAACCARSHRWLFGEVSECCLLQILGCLFH